MLYSSLSEIKLSAFIDAITGNARAVVKDSPSLHSDEECKETAGILMMQYIDACGGSGNAAKLGTKKKNMNLCIKSRLIEICENLAESGLYEDVVPIMMKMGYKLHPKDRDGIVQRITQLKGRIAYDMDLMNQELANNKSDGMTKSDFTKERVAIMTHYKIYVDPDIYTAEEYACLVSQFNREYEELRRNIAKRQ